MKAFLFIPLFMFLSFHGKSQQIDHMAVYRITNSDAYLRVHYDNDFFTGTDYYYTQGYTIELASPALAGNPLKIVLPSFKHGINKYGIAFEHFGFTPADIQSAVILTEDRPFAAVMLLKSFQTSVDSVRKTRLSSAISLGMIGPAALGGPMQTKIHEMIGDRIPMGWQHEIQNDVAINYELGFEQQLFSLDSYLQINSDAKLRAGTLMNSLQGGFTIMAGKAYSPFINSTSRNELQIYLYCQPLLRLVAYDATLQGGLLNRSSPHTLNPQSMNHVVGLVNYGLVFAYKSVFLSYGQTATSKAFHQGMPHRWGSISLGASL